MDRQYLFRENTGGGRDTEVPAAPPARLLFQIGVPSAHLFFGDLLGVDDVGYGRL